MAKPYTEGLKLAFREANLALGPEVAEKTVALLVELWLENGLDEEYLKILRGKLEDDEQYERTVVQIKEVIKENTQ